MIEFVTFLFASSHFGVAHVASTVLLQFSVTSELGSGRQTRASETQRWDLYRSYIITKGQLMGIWGDSGKNARGQDPSTDCIRSWLLCTL